MIGIGIFFIILGLLVKYGKLYFLIAGYNAMPKEKKAEYNIEGIASVFCNSMLGMGTILVSGNFAANWLQEPELKSPIFYGTLLIGILYLIIASNSGKYKKNENGQK